MEEKKEVIVTEQSSSVENKPSKQEKSKNMVEDKSEVEELKAKVEEKVENEVAAVQEEKVEANTEDKPIEEKGEEAEGEVKTVQKEKELKAKVEEKVENEVAAVQEEKVQANKEDKPIEEKKEEAEVEVKTAQKDKELKANVEEKVENEVAAVQEKAEANKEDKPIEEKSEESKVEVKTEKKVDEPISENSKPAENAPKEDELAGEDFSKYTKSQIVDLVKVLAKHKDPLYAERYFKQIEPRFEEIKKIEIEEAKAAYIKENGNDDGFNFDSDELTNRFYANSRLIHDHRHTFFKDREAQRQINLKKAEEALEKLREFVDSEESSASFNKFKDIQNEWKAIGDVPGNQSKTLWANYNALINRFYDQRSIYFELKELDRKKNYEYKVKICERAEALENFENLKDSINTLNELHDEYKHLGPVPQELQEDLWSRFKSASDKVYKKRKEFVSDLKVVLLENLKKKEELVESIKLFVEFDSDRIKAWNAKTKELLELQKKWETIGGLPREKSKDINKNFWSNFKLFFHNKSNFFKKLDEERKGNYDAKLILVEKAEALKENKDWFKTANDFKSLQQEWKGIGPVPEKVRNDVYEKFKAACDFFFDNKRSNSKDEEKNFKENLKLKKDIISQFENWAEEADDHIDEFKLKAKEFAAIGFVPRKEINSLKENFLKAVNKFISGLSSEDDVKNRLKLEVELGDILGSKNSEQVLYGKEQNVRRQVQQLENDIALWKNNLEFFAHSKTKNADDLRKDVNQKIDKAELRVVGLKDQLKLLRSI